jgi:DNA-binding MarR family transcriptional regulator
MISITPAVKFFLDLNKIQTVTTRRFDRSLGGLSFNEFIILYHLSQAHDESLPRIDLSEKIGLTASGVTRLLAPMEKIGMIKRNTNKLDARISLVTLAPGGKQKLSEAIERAELLAEEIIPAEKLKKIKEIDSELLSLMEKFL